MEAIKIYRDANQQQVFDGLAKKILNPSWQAGQVNSSVYWAELQKLPHVRATLAQNLNPASPGFGKFLFMAGYSLVGGPDVIG